MPTSGTVNRWLFAVFFAAVARPSPKSCIARLFDVGKDVVNPAARLTPVGAPVGVTGPRNAPAVGRKPLAAVLVVQAGQGGLLQIVLTLQQPGRLAGGLTAGSSNAIKMPMIVITTSNSTSVKPV